MKCASSELALSRKGEIIRACEQLYETCSYRDITIKKIAESTSFTRPSIYNYFQTKEEIFLAFLSQEYGKWLAYLTQMEKAPPPYGKELLAEGLARSLEDRVQMLKIFSMNLNEIEGNSRIENLVEFKRVYAAVISALKRITLQYCPELCPDAVNGFVSTFLPFLFGIYPCTHRTEKQIAAMDRAGMQYQNRSIREVVYTFVRMMIG